MARPKEKVLEFPVVGIGASAGGITAIQSLLQAMGDGIHAAIVIVQHLPPGKPSGLSGLIRKWTRLEVHDAVEGLRPAPGHLYLPAPNEVLTLESGVFRTRPSEGGSRRPGIDTIDAFLESLARDCGPRAVAVVLSGSGMDGTAGAIQVRQAGGLVLVQEPITALHDGMPASVIHHGGADQVLSIAGIADELAAMGSPSYARPASSASQGNEVTRTLDEILALVRKQAGFDLGSYKPSPVLWRIQQRMDLREVRRFSEYAALLRDDPFELESLVRGLPIHVTDFFRDAGAWKVLDEEVVRRLDPKGPVRAWTAACATGEEAYSVAMLLAENADRGGSGDFQVFASDASPAIVARASRGVFTEDAMWAVSRERRQRFFDPVDGKWEVKRTLRERMVFVPHDLLLDAPFTQLDLVTCRNLLIYLEPAAIDRVLGLLHGSLRMGGCLFLGRGEPLCARQPGFEPVSGKAHVYRKASAAAPARGIQPKRQSERIAEATRAARDELDASREELQALNEELKASNDLLKTSNDDLNHANNQLQEKVAQLQLQSRVLSSGEVATIFLDTERRVRWFTPAVVELFPLQAGDEGRDLVDLAPRFEDAAFFDDVDSVMRTGVAREAQVRHRSGRWYLRRIRPFLSHDGADGTGVAVNFTDVTASTRG